MEKQLTLLIVVHSDFDSVEHYTKQYLQSKNNHPILFAFDTTKEKIPEHCLEILEKNKINYFINQSNTGKMKLVLKVLDMIETRFFKIVDQDDSIYFKGLKKIDERLIKFDDQSIIKHRAAKIKRNLFTKRIHSRSLNKFTTFFQKIIGKNVYYDQLTNCETIYSKKMLLGLQKIDVTRQSYHDDPFLSNYCLAKGAKIKKIKNKFYIQFHEKGQTSGVSIGNSTGILELYENYKRIKEQDESFDFSKIFKGKIWRHNRFIKRYSVQYLDDYILSNEIYSKSMTIALMLNGHFPSRDSNDFSVAIVSDFSKDIEGAKTLIKSIKLNSIKINYIYLLTSSNSGNVKIIESFINQNEMNYKTFYIDDILEDKINFSKLKDNLPNNIKHIPKFAFGKMLIPCVLPFDENILYLDTDTIVKGGLYFPSKNNKAISVSRNANDSFISSAYWKKTYGDTFNNIKETNEKAFNSGVIFFHKRTKEENDILNELLFKNINFSKFNYLDQGYLNYSLKDEVYYIPESFNFPHHKLRFRKVRNIKNPVIIHFASSSKPWNKNLKTKYYKYWKKINEKIQD